ncbi:hypothetical protein BDF21DRAFT_394506 [Thamnidium elegans]|nr:hypothetical protein BDF21DRAFT_394506 [Thamnidium elegans]
MNPPVRIVKDLCLIDFVELTQKRTVLKQNVVNTHSALVNQVIDSNENIFGASTDLVPITNIVNLNKLDTEKKSLNMSTPLKDNLDVYSLQKITEHCYVFLLEKKVAISSNPTGIYGLLILLSREEIFAYL